MCVSIKLSFASIWGRECVYWGWKAITLASYLERPGSKAAIYRQPTLNLKWATMEISGWCHLSTSIYTACGQGAFRYPLTLSCFLSLYCEIIFTVDSVCDGEPLFPPVTRAINEMIQGTADVLYGAFSTSINSVLQHRIDPNKYISLDKGITFETITLDFQTRLICCACRGDDWPCDSMAILLKHHLTSHSI